MNEASWGYSIVQKGYDYGYTAGFLRMGTFIAQTRILKLVLQRKHIRANLKFRQKNIQVLTL